MPKVQSWRIDNILMNVKTHQNKNVTKLDIFVMHVDFLDEFC